MTSDEQRYILYELERMEPDIRDLDPMELYRRCYAVCEATNGYPRKYVLTHMIDAETLAGKWYWRERQ